MSPSGHENLLELRNRGFVNGVPPLIEHPWEQLRRADLPPGPLYIELEYGTFKHIDLPSLGEYHEDDTSWPEFSPGGIVVTASGRNHVVSLLAETSGDLGIFGERMLRLVELGFFDTAVREACLGPEDGIKIWLKSDRWGDALVEEFMLQLRKSGNY